MNKGRTTMERIKWTTPSLNELLPIQHDLEELQVHKKEKQEHFVSGTLNDVQKLYNHIVSKLEDNGANLANWKLKFQVNYWWATDAPAKIKNVIPSNSLETAWNNVSTWHEKHKKAWDAEIDDTDEFYNEPESSDSDLSSDSSDIEEEHIDLDDF